MQVMQDMQACSISVGNYRRMTGCRATRCQSLAGDSALIVLIVLVYFAERVLDVQLIS
jgi:hypothetical protein